MNLLNQTLEICKLYNIKPSKSKGQNFLINEDVYNLIIESADLSEDDVVLEVGPGLGFLTHKLAKKSKKVLAIELDDDIAEFLKISIISKNLANIKLFNNDVLKIKGEKIDALGKYKIVSNLPYNISSVFLRKFLSLNNKPELIVLLLQKELVERILSKPGNLNLLALSVQFYADAEIIAKVPASDFYPAPKVDSAIIKIKPRESSLLPSYQEEKKFFSLLKAGFGSKRKMLKNNLESNLHLSKKEVYNLFDKLKIDYKSRAEDLDLKQWLSLYSLLFC